MGTLLKSQKIYHKTTSDANKKNVLNSSLKCKKRGIFFTDTLNKYIVVQYILKTAPLITIIVAFMDSWMNWSGVKVDILCPSECHLI